MVDPLTLASSFATVVGLLSAFVSERRATRSLTLEDFLNWLKSRGFEELMSELQENSRASLSIESILNESSAALLQRLNRLDQTLASLASHYEGLGHLATALRGTDNISEAALSLLRYLETAGIDAFWVSYANDRPPVLESMAGRFDYGETRFLEDDLESLVEIGLLRLDQTSRGEPLYRFTRAASKFVREAQNAGSNQAAPPDG